jgi:hypothetical protein
MYFSIKPETSDEWNQMKSHKNMVFRDYSSPYISEEHVYKRLSTRHLWKTSKSDLTCKIFKSPFIAATIFFSPVWW